MFGGILQAGTKALGGARFSLVNLMPTAFLITSIAILIASGVYTQPKPSLTSLFHELSKSPGLALAAAFGIFLITVLLRPFQTALVQFLEGYWQRWPPLGLANDLATERHRRLLNTAHITIQSAQKPVRPAGSEFSEVADYARQLREIRRIHRRTSIKADWYPRSVEGSGGFIDDRLMPTLLGNVLRDGEDNAGRRYGLDMTIVYPRMYPSISTKLDKAISAQLDMLDTASALCIAFALITLIALPLVARVDWWSLTPLIAVLMSALAYRGAIATARKHGRLLATAFDLHRFDMLEALHYELPLTPQDELDLNTSLSRFLESHDTVKRMRKFSYRHATTSTAQEEQSTGSNGATDDDTSTQ
jgi:hypothetical protein